MSFARTECCEAERDSPIDEEIPACPTDSASNPNLSSPAPDRVRAAVACTRGGTWFGEMLQ